MKRICVIGGGRWGRNHVKTLAGLQALAAVTETNPDLLRQYQEQYPGIQGYTDVDEAIRQRYDGYVVATPAETHFDIAMRILKAGLPVLVEKPMTLSASSSEELIQTAKAAGVSLMVGHLLLFHPAIRKIKSLIDGNRIGALRYLYSNRLNFGTIRTEENVFWSFAPHDISVMDYFVGHPAIHIEAKGSRFLQERIDDVAMAQLSYPGNIQAHIFVSWLHPFKEQRFVVVGDQGMISFDDASEAKEIRLYHKRVVWEQGKPLKVEAPYEMVPYDRCQPLEEELKYFMSHLDRPVETADGRSGYEVVKILETVQHLIAEKHDTIQRS